MPSVPPSPRKSREDWPDGVFVGRDAELQQVLRHAGRRRLEGPGIAVVTAVAGMGKTALLRRVADELTDQLVITVAAGAGDRPFAVADRLVERLVERATGPAPVSAPMSGPDEPPHAAGQRLLTALGAASTTRPVTVIVDDVQHADVESSLALGFAARRLYGQQVLFVLAVRSPHDSVLPPNVRRIMPARGDVLHVRLSGLSVAEIETLGLASGVVRAQGWGVTAQLIHEHCDGNPRYVTRLLEEIQRDPHVRSGRSPLPLRSFSVTLSEQVAELPPASRSLLWALAVLDDRCPLSTVAGVADVAQPLDALEPLLAAGLVQWWPAEPTTPMCIRTPLQRTAAYQTMDVELRRQLHERAARVVPFDRALLHRMRAVRGQPDPALGNDLTVAGWRWATEGDLTRAARYLRWASDVSPPGSTKERRLLFATWLLQRGSRNEAAAALRGRARDCRPSPLRNCVMGRYAMVDGDLATARELFESAVAELELDPAEPGFAAVAAIGYTWLALLDGWQGRSAQARAAAARCLAISPFGRRIDRGTELLYLAMCCQLDGPTAAMERLTGMVQLPAAPSEVDPADVMLLFQRGHLRLLMGEPAEAVADLETGLRTAASVGITDIDEWAHLWAGCAYIALGSWDRAAEHAKAALDTVIADSRPYLWMTLALTAYVEARTGQLAAAAEHAGEAVELTEAIGLSGDRALPALAAAAIATANGDPLGAVEALRGFTSGATGWTRVYRWLWWPSYLDALLDLGRADAAEAGLAEIAAEIDHGYRVLIVPHLYLTGRAREAAGDRDGAAAAYRRTVDAPAGLGGDEWRARAAAAHRRLTGRTATGGPMIDRLTGRERTIARLICDGLTNRAVSARLGITEKTIEAHLTRVYRKLDVKSRGELLAVLSGRTPGAARVPDARSASNDHSRDASHDTAGGRR